MSHLLQLNGLTIVLKITSSIAFFPIGGVQFERGNGYSASIDRISENPKEPHTIKNCRVVCRFFNTNPTWDNVTFNCLTSPLLRVRNDPKYKHEKEL